MQDGVYTTGQIAKFCEVGHHTVNKWFDNPGGMLDAEHRLNGYRVPGSQDRRVPRDEIIRFLKVHDMYEYYGSRFEVQ
jgi:two-component system response regulator RpaA